MPDKDEALKCMANALMTLSHKEFSMACHLINFRTDIMSMYVCEYCDQELRKGAEKKFGLAKHIHAALKKRLEKQQKEADMYDLGDQS